MTALLVYFRHWSNLKMRRYNTFESVCLLLNKSIEANSVDPDQTASR